MLEINELARAYARKDFANVERRPKGTPNLIQKHFPNGCRHLWDEQPNTTEQEKRDFA